MERVGIPHQVRTHEDGYRRSRLVMIFCFFIFVRLLHEMRWASCGTATVHVFPYQRQEGPWYVQSRYCMHPHHHIAHGKGVRRWDEL